MSLSHSFISPKDTNRIEVKDIWPHLEEAMEELILNKQSKNVKLSESQIKSKLQKK